MYYYFCLFSLLRLDFPQPSRGRTWLWFRSAPGLEHSAVPQRLHPCWRYTTTGSLVQTIALPTAVSGANQILTLSGTATSEGFLALSANGQYLTVGGYNQAVGTASITTSIGNRTVGRIDMLGSVDSTTILGDAASIGNIRSVVSDNGGGFWVGSSAGGMRYTTLGSTAASTQLNSAAPTNLRVANIFGGQLYARIWLRWVSKVWHARCGLPTTTRAKLHTLLSGFPTAAGPRLMTICLPAPNTCMWLMIERPPAAAVFKNGHSAPALGRYPIR